ncbi:hypothetical protein AX16_009711, partial [Volvariella volvacea WC 439]
CRPSQRALFGETMISVEFVQLCIAFAHAQYAPISPTSSTLSDFSHPSLQPSDTATSLSTVASIHSVSEDEAKIWYSGVSPDPPLLVFRTGRDKHPWVEPKGLEAYRTFKSVRGVFGHALKTVWKTVGRQTLDLLKDRNIRYTSVDPARFITYGDADKEIPGPVVVWVGVYPGSTDADTAFDLSKEILALLASVDIYDVEVEWREAIYSKAAGPALLRPVGNVNNIVDVCGPLTATLAVPIATSDRPDAQGTLGFYFHEGGDSEKVMGVTCHHVLFKTDQQNNVKYEFKGAGAPPKFVRALGLRRFQKLLDDIKLHIGRRGIMVDIHERDIKKLEEKVKSEDEQEAAEAAEELEQACASLTKANKAIEDLETFYTQIMTKWGDSELRNIGHIHYSPAISFNVGEEGYTEDWGTFELDAAKFKDAFRGNVIDLGTEIPRDDFTLKMYPRPGKTTFKYPEGRLLKISGILSKELLYDPDMVDGNDDPCLIVIKDGNTTGVTIGRMTGLESFTRDDKTGEEFIELAIYNYDKNSCVFSAKGDSGSLIVDGLGRMAGLLTGGSYKTLTATADVTYATPMWWLWARIKAKYPHADLFRTTFFAV